TRPSQSEAGREMPRGGRSGTKTRARVSAPADVRDALTQQLDLPRSDARERVWVDDRPYDVRQSEVRTLAANSEARQAYYSGITKPRELGHDARLYRAYATAATRLHETGARVRRVVLD